MGRETNPRKITRSRVDGKTDKVGDAIFESFTDEWIGRVRDGIKRMRENDIDLPNHVFSSSAQLMMAFFCLSTLALGNLSKEERMRVWLQAENVYRRFGVSTITDKSFVKRCLTKMHEECLGSYQNLMKEDVVKCNCPCHSNSKKS